MAANKFYAVRNGKKRGIFRTWEECRASVDGYSGAEYKSFKTEQEARAFLGIGQDFSAKNDLAGRECVKIYVDGSYNHATGEFSYGMVVLRDGREETYNRKFEDEELASMRNVAGEIKGAEAAMQYALEHGLSRIEIFHDYEGIAKWPLGLWKTNKEGTKAYRAFYDMASQSVTIDFVKVTGHSNDTYNDMADKLAKEALGL